MSCVSESRYRYPSGRCVNVTAPASRFRRFQEPKAPATPVKPSKVLLVKPSKVKKQPSVWKCHKVIAIPYGVNLSPDERKANNEHIVQMRREYLVGKTVTGDLVIVQSKGKTSYWIKWTLRKADQVYIPPKVEKKSLPERCGCRSFRRRQGPSGVYYHLSRTVQSRWPRGQKHLAYASTVQRL